MTTRDAGNGGAGGHCSSPNGQYIATGTLIGSASRPGTRAAAPAQEQANQGAGHEQLGFCRSLVCKAQ